VQHRPYNVYFGFSEALEQRVVGVSDVDGQSVSAQPVCHTTPRAEGDIALVGYAASEDENG
jgi:hypothetical protein